MRNMLLLVILMTFASSGLFAMFTDSDIYSFTFNGKTYEVVKQLKTWSNAVAFAVERGGYLVEINSQEEQNAIFDAIINGAEVSEYYTYVANGGGIAYVWIGATDQNEEGVWLWDGNNDNQGVNFWVGQGQNGANTGYAVDGAYYNWGGTSTGTPMEPDNWNGQHYAAIGLTGWPQGASYLGIAGEWNDIIGTVPLYFVIEYDTNSSFNDTVIEPEVNFVLYPNPANSVIKFNKPELIKTLEVFNIRGQRIILTNQNELQMSGYAKGLYFIKINNRHVHKITIK